MITSKHTHEHKVPRYEGPKESLTTLIFRDQPDQLLAPVNQSPSGCIAPQPIIVELIRTPPPPKKVSEVSVNRKVSHQR